MSSQPSSSPGPGGSEEQDRAAAEERLRGALRDAAAGVPTSVWPAGAVLARARRRRRARWCAMTVPFAAVVACAGVLVAGGSGPPSGERVSPAAPSTAPSRGPGPSVPPPAGPPAVRVVEPGQVMTVGNGVRIRLESGRSCVKEGTAGAVWNCSSVTDGNQSAGSISLRTVGDQDGLLYAPLYVGDGTVARMTVTVRGHTYPVQVLTLPGHPGYATGYAETPQFSQDGGSLPPQTTTVYDARGRVLATFRM